MEALTYSYPVWLYLVVAADWDKPCVCPKKKNARYLRQNCQIFIEDMMIDPWLFGVSLFITSRQTPIDLQIIPVGNCSQ